MENHDFWPEPPYVGSRVGGGWRMGQQKEANMEDRKRQVYETPELIEHGDLEEITMMVSPVGNPDGST